MGVAAGVAPVIESRTAGEPRDAARVDQAGERRLARVESLRALAAISVLVGHVWGADHAFGQGARDSLLARTIFGGGYGVYVFFALSGYLLFRPLAAATFDGGKVDLRRYAINRVLRILPLYYVVVVVLLVVQEGGGTPGQWLRFLTLTENLFRSTALTVDAPIWSLIVEIQFYALLPLVAIGVARLTGGSRRHAATLLLLAGLGGAALRWELINHRHATDPRIVYSLATTAFFFVPGMLLALVGEVRLPRALRHADLWLLASVPVWLWIFDDYRRTPWAAVACFLVVGAATLPLTPGPLTRALDWRPLALIGVASYSLYLWHLPIVEALAPHALAFSVPASLAVALVSYRFVEAPFLRQRRRWSSSS
jgi:peptidoglycan/LPS O-acetylase OafA/YrhL